MNSTLGDVQAPSYRKCLLPSMARTPSVTQVTPAKKITFLKRGDPRFSGVRLAVHQRTFKSFGTLMDELSQRVPLSFGVRSVTTPRGLHGLSALEQLEDGGCYLCSDKKPPKTSSGPGQPPGRSTAAQRSQDVEDQCEAPRTPSSQRGPKAPRRIMLVKNGDPRFQQTVLLSRRNTRSLTAFLSKASDLLLFPVKQVYTTSGEKVDSLKALLRGPSVLVCAGHESFRPPAVEGARKNGTETSLGQTSRNKNGSWGPKTQQSVIHSSSRTDSRPPRFSLLSERPGLSDSLVSLHRAWMGPTPERPPQDTPAQLGPLVTGDDVEKKVRMNEDGSLSVEMKVRFHLLGDDMLLWSRRVGRDSALTAAHGEADALHCVWEGHPGGSSEPGAQRQKAGEAGCKEAFEQGRWQPGSRYEIWTNPLYTAQGDATASRRRSGLTQHSHSRGAWSQGLTSRQRSIKESVSPASSDRPPEGSGPNSSCCSRSREGSVGSCDLYLASRAASQRRAGQEAESTPWAGEGPGPEAAGRGSREHHCLKPRTQGVAGTHSDSSASARSHEESIERDKWHQGHPSMTRAVISSWKATQRGGPRYSTMSPSPLRNKDPQAKENGKDPGYPQARGRSGTRLPLDGDHFGSGDTAGGCSPPSAHPSATGGRRMQESRVSAVSSPSISGISRGAQRDCPGHHHNHRDTHCLLHSPVSRQIPGPPSIPRASPVPHRSGSSSSTRNRASQDPGPSSSASLHSQDAEGVSSALITPVSNSDCASNFYPPSCLSADTEGDPEFSSFRSQADGLGKKAGGDIPKPPHPLILSVGQHEGEKPGAHQGACCSQMGISPVHRTPGGKTQALHVPQPQGSQGPFSEACLVYSRHCPTPPRAQPSVKKHPLCSSRHGNEDHSTDWGAEPGEEKLDLQHPQASSSQSGAMGVVIRAPRRSSPSLGPGPGRMFQGQVTGAGAGLEEQEDDGGMTPGSLPHALPEAVVREWLRNIPGEPMPMKYEMVNESTDGSGDSQEGAMEVPVEKHSLGGLEEQTQARRPHLEGSTSEKAEPDDRTLPGMGDAGPQSGEGLPHGGVSEAPKEAGTGEGMAEGCGMGQCVLPRRVSASIQIMKVLMGSKQGRPSSLPEVSSSVGRRLSHSAQALITCLTRLHFFDEDLGSPTSKVRFTDSPQYQELLSTFQALWPGCGLRRGEPDSDLGEPDGCQALPGLRSHTVTEDFTPTSSSGVDVGSGSGGSGEGSAPCTVGCILVPERIELPLKIPGQRPDSRTSENPVDLGNQQPSGSMASSSPQAWVCATGKDGAEGSSGEQTLGSNLDQVIENTMQEDAVQIEKIKEEKERAEPQGQGISRFPEEGRDLGQEPSGAGSQDREGALEDESVQEETGRDPAFAMLHPPGRREKWTETLGSLREKDSNASGSQSGPNAETSLEKLPTAAETNHEQTQAKFTQGAGEKGTAMAHRATLDPDPLWVSKLLRKMEKAFMAHLASATAELQARWSLQSNDLLDQMVAELQQDVGQRLRNSTEKELRKIQSRAAGKALRPPRVALRWEISLQTELRRRRLQGLRNLSAFSDQIRVWGPPSSYLEDTPPLSRALETWPGGEAEGDEFCPCETCVKKKVTAVSPKDTIGVASAPIKEAFDLQQILQKKKGGCANGETAAVAPENTGMEPLQRDPSGTGAVQGADGGLKLGSGRGSGVEEGDEGEGRQSLGRDEDLGRGEKGVATQEIEGNRDPCVDCPPEAMEREKQGVGAKEENIEEGCGAEDSVQGEASGGSDQRLGGQNDGADSLEAQETEGERQPESKGGKQGEKGSPQAGPRWGQSGEASGHSNPDQEGRPTPPPAPGGDAPHQTSGPKTGLSSCSTSSLGNCSQLSQKGSEEEPSDGDMRTTGDEPKGVPCPERKVTGMYPQSSTSEQEGARSGSRTPERGTDKGLTPETGAGQGSDLEAKKVVKSLTRTEMRFQNLTMDRTDGFGQDDLDF
ncbi:RP1 like 1 [Rhinolophus ferrumequinum]|uniref:Retinitis pigmentosa 1-like 1 protein n=1 Tax=Rhinolophus ferrumequinum TaxID=59479 RepID=A0A7J7U2C8_RHIFE|nr:retinitis pigmentosa 1-like 1 protein [Rhinolophus ferrumequinum]KAF6307077.1 RP1 like 1 [Rhinolophus ferrumequinum]